jgi:hypothetical protein
MLSSMSGVGKNIGRMYAPPAKNPYLCRDTILKLISAPNLEHKDLAAKVQDSA